jgi:hypothetical protein
MSTIKSENWDGVTAPALPSGWNAQASGGYAAVTTSTGAPSSISSPNTIYLPASYGLGGPRSITWATLDGNSGDVQVVGTGLFAANTGNSEFSVFARANTSAWSSTTDTAYAWAFSGSNGTFEVRKYVAGSASVLFSIAVSAFTANVYYRITGSVFGATPTEISATVTRLSDGYTLNFSSGNFVAGLNQLSITDSSSPITGQGYSGWQAWPAAAVPVYGDDWSLSTFNLNALTAVEHHDTFAGSSSFATHGSIARTAGSDTFAAPGLLTIPATIARTESHDTFAGSAAFAAHGSMARAEARDVFAGLSLGAHAAAGESHDTFAGSSSFAAGSGIAPIERHDVASIFAKVSPFLQGTEHRDTFAASGTATHGPASLAGVEAHDTFAAAGGFTFDTTATFAPGERGDVFAAAGVQSSSATMAATETGDVFASTVSFRSIATMGVVENGDVFSGGYERVGYHVYANTGVADPINYDAPIDTTTLLTYTTAPLSYPGTWEFGVRAFYVISGLEEQNLDCSLTIILDTMGHDITNRPLPPTSLRALARAGGAIRVEWTYPPTTGSRAPTGFHVYAGTGGVPNYATPLATVSAKSSFGSAYVSNLTGFIDGATYTIGVRAFNSTAEEPNINTVNVTADATGPSAVVSLTGTAIS